MALHIDNNSFAFLVEGNEVIGAVQEGKTCPLLPDASGYIYIVKKGVPITIVSDVGEDLTASITIPGGGVIANNVTVKPTLEDGYTFTTYSNETYISAST